jgi:dipeptidyl aminopeptidase/acylaminoacyl peptidase
MPANLLMTRRLLLALLLTTAAMFSFALAAEPEKVHKANYPQAFKFSREFVQQFSYDTAINPQWIGKTDNFWYFYRTSKGTNYWKVNSADKKKEPLFDHVKLAAQLSELSKKPVEANGLSLTRVTITDDAARLKFVFEEYQYEFEIATNKLTKGGKAPPRPAGPPGRFGQNQDDQQRREQIQEQIRQQQDQQQQQQQQEQQRDQQQQDQQNQNQQQQGQGNRPNFGDYRNFSPDKKFYVYCYKYNLYLAEADKEKEAIQLSKDGEEDHSFSFAGGMFGGRGNNNTTTTEERKPDPERKTRVNASWAGDSKALYVTRTDARGVKDLFLVDSIAQPRPKLETYKYPMPGEENTRKQEFFYVKLDDKKLMPLKTKWKDERYFNPHWLGKTSDELRYTRRDRLQRNIEFCSLDTKTGTEKCLISEGIDNGNLEFQNVRYIEDTNEMIWWSERTGWGEFYLYDKNGTLKNPITSGPFRASRIVNVDSKNRILYFQGNAREAGENVYYQHLYSVHLTGSEMTLLDPGNANHTSTLSPNNKFLVDNSSRIDDVPFSVLRDINGQKVMDLEKCDLSRLQETGWKMPTTFTVKAADGITDLYGNMWLPFDFDKTKKYPIIANVYPGPQTEGVTHTFAAYSQQMQLAQLGFVVIQVGHRGGTPTRSKAYHRYGYFNLRDYALEDKKSAIEQLALRFPYIDIDRVGIYGHSGGGFLSAAALLQKPYNDFFKAAVASSGNHDNNIYNDNWSERYHGMKEVPADQKDAATTTAAATTQENGQNGQGQGQRRRRPPEEGGNPDTKTEIDQQQLDAIKKELAEIATKLAAAKGDELEKLEKQLADAKDRLGKLSGKAVSTNAAPDIEKKSPILKFDIHVPTNAELAGNLKGALLLVHGEIDNNVHPANTMRLVDALIKANKRFDMLILPGQRHGYSTLQPYFNQRMWDFFSDHLLGDRQSGSDITEKKGK